MGRRESLRQGIPDSIPLPKFLTTDELELIKQYKRDNPAVSWDDAITEIIKTNSVTLDLA